MGILSPDSALCTRRLLDDWPCTTHDHVLILLWRTGPMSTLLDDLTAQLQGNTLSQMSRQLGADEATTEQAITVALPMLIGGLANEAATPTGAQSLTRALEEDHDGSLLDNVSRLFGPQTSGA